MCLLAIYLHTQQNNSITDSVGPSELRHSAPAAVNPWTDAQMASD